MRGFETEHRRLLGTVTWRPRRALYRVWRREKSAGHGSREPSSPANAETTGPCRGDDRQVLGHVLSTRAHPHRHPKPCRARISLRVASSNEVITTTNPRAEITRPGVVLSNGCATGWAMTQAPGRWGLALSSGRVREASRPSGGELQRRGFGRRGSVLRTGCGIALPEKRRGAASVPCRSGRLRSRQFPPPSRSTFEPCWSQRTVSHQRARIAIESDTTRPAWCPLSSQRSPAPTVAASFAPISKIAEPNLPAAFPAPERRRPVPNVVDEVLNTYFGVRFDLLFRGRLHHQAHSQGRSGCVATELGALFRTRRERARGRTHERGGSVHVLPAKHAKGDRGNGTDETRSSRSTPPSAT